MKKLIAGVCVSMFVLVGCGQENKNDQTVGEQDKPAVPLPTYTAKQIQHDYEANSVAADDKYKDKQFKVTGKVTDISTDIMGSPYITMGGTNSLMQPQFSFDDEAKPELAKISKGMKLTLVCEGNGDMAKIPMSKNCKIAR